jgi:hypothetical protein
MLNNFIQRLKEAFRQKHVEHIGPGSGSDGSMWSDGDSQRCYHDNDSSDSNQGWFDGWFDSDGSDGDDGDGGDGGDGGGD